MLLSTLVTLNYLRTNLKRTALSKFVMNFAFTLTLRITTWIGKFMEHAFYRHNPLLLFYKDFSDLCRAWHKCYYCEPPGCKFQQASSVRES